MYSLMGHQTWIETELGEVITLSDILPERSRLRMLLVGKTPAPVSVEAGHYFQGKQGKAFWRLLREYGILASTSQHEDDALLAQGIGLTDIAKIPREYGRKVSAEEYQMGSDRILGLVHKHRPKVTLFVYKGVLDNILRYRFKHYQKSDYGLNPELDGLFGSIVFTFPMPGTPCTKMEQVRAMDDLRRIMGV